MMLCRSNPMTMVPTTLVFTLLMFRTSVKPNTALDRDAKKRATSVRPSLRRSSTSSLTTCTMNLIFSRIAASSPNNGFRVLESTSLPISSSLRGRLVLGVAFNSPKDHVPLWVGGWEEGREGLCRVCCWR